MTDFLPLHEKLSYIHNYTTQSHINTQHTPANTYTGAPMLGSLTRRLRNTMTRGHLAVMEPFVCGNSHFPV